MTKIETKLWWKFGCFGGTAVYKFFFSFLFLRFTPRRWITAFCVHKKNVLQDKICAWEVFQQFANVLFFTSFHSRHFDMDSHTHRQHSPMIQSRSCLQLATKPDHSECNLLSARPGSKCSCSCVLPGLSKLNWGQMVHATYSSFSSYIFPHPFTSILRILRASSNF